MKNWIKNESLLYAVIVSSIVALLLFFATGQDGLGVEVEASSCEQFKYMLIEVKSIEYDGVMFHDKQATVEPDIFMTDEQLDYQTFNVGDIVMGRFDADGWELFEVTKY